MNEQDRFEFVMLQRQQQRLEREVTGLGERIEQLRTRVEVTDVPITTVQPTAPAAEPIWPAQSTVTPAANPLKFEPRPTGAATPPPLPTTPPPLVPPAAPATPSVVWQSAPPPVTTQSPQPAATSTPKESKSFEMRLGTYWLVRIGIVMLLTSLVFLGNYAYKNYFALLGAAGKVSLLYLASSVLIGFGAWFSRRDQKESLKNYGQVLFAGGLAAVYFTTYAAHYFENLQVITSPVVDGILLLAWAAGVVVLADRRKSEVLALFAVGLAYYSSVITHIGLFTLYSNLVLTAAAVYFLIRNRWTTLSFASLVATYAGFAFWRFYTGNDWQFSYRENDLWNGNIFLAGYWLAFTAATFLSREGKLQHERRAVFASLNNGAFFLMVILSMFQVHNNRFWMFSLGFGVVLLTLAYVARRLLPAETTVKNAYVGQGLVLVTVGLIAHYTGLRLALVLAAESVILFALGLTFDNRWLRRGAYVTAVLAAIWATFGMEKSTAEAVLGGAVGALLLFNAVWARRQGPCRDGGELQARPMCFAFLGLWVWLVAVDYNVAALWRSPILAALTLVLTASYYLLKNREISLLSQLYLMVAVVRWMMLMADKSLTLPWWNPVILIGSLLTMSHWWQRQKSMPEMAKDGGVFQGIYALSFISVVFLWLHPRFAPENWLMYTSFFAIGITAYGIATRAWFLAGCGQLFLWISAWEFVRQITSQSPSWFIALTPIATLIGTVMAVTAWLDAAEEKGGSTANTIRGVGDVYHCAALIMSLWWVNHYIPAQEQFWVLSALATGLFALAGWQRSRRALVYSGVLYATGWAWFFFFFGPDRPLVYWPNLLCIFLLLGLQRVARHLADRYDISRPMHGAMMVTGTLALWLYLSRWGTIASGGHFFLTASWAVLALAVFATGFLLRERTYRWLGLGILAVALARVIFVDVWKLATIYRILSFMAMGIVPIVIGFIYNKYEEKIKEWM